MTFLSILWDFDPQIVDFLPPRWYGLLFGLAFIVTQQMMTKIYKKEGLNPKEVDFMLLYMVAGTIIGARIGHCLFYDWDHYTQDFSHIISILYVWEGGLASHGGGLGLLLASYLFAKKYKVKSYLWLIDRVALAVVLGGALIRLGNFANSEIVGIPTDKSWGIVFSENARNSIKALSPVEVEVSFDLRELAEGEGIMQSSQGIKLVPIAVTVDLAAKMTKKELEMFNHNIRLGQTPDGYLLGLNILPEDLANVRISDKAPVYKNNNKTLVFEAFGIPRHPAQLYESISCLLIFVLLFFIYSKFNGNSPGGLLFGLFAILVFSLRFLYEYIKENQVAIEEGMTINIGQKLSIPLIIAGVVLVVISLKKRNDTKET